MPDAFRAANVGGVARAIAGGYTLLLAGPADRMKGRLTALGAVETLAPESEPSVADPATRVTPEQRRRGRQLVAAAVAAHGGTAKLNAVRASEQLGELRMSAAGRDLSGECRYVREDPARLVYTTRILDFEHRQVLDGKRGWALSMVGDSATLVDSDSTSLTSLRSILENDVVHLLRAANEPAADPFSQGKGELDGKPCDLVEFVTPLGMRTRLSLDPVTHRILAVEGAPTPQGAWRDRRRWSEYILVEGVWWPQREVREVDGENVSTTNLRRLTVNAPVDSMLFRRPLVVRGQVRGVQ